MDLKNNKQEELWKSIQGVAGITDAIRNSAVNTAFLNPQKPKKSVDDIIEEELDNDDNDLTAEHCKICGKEMENLYSWYNLTQYLPGTFFRESDGYVAAFRHYSSVFSYLDVDNIYHDIGIGFGK